MRWAQRIQRGPVIALSMKPGATQFTVTFRLATSWASALEKPIIPALDAA